MDAIQIRLFGGLQLVRPDGTAITLQPVVQEFLAYLLLNRERFHCREILSGLLWGELEENQARRCLSTALWRLRQQLEPDGTPRGTFVTIVPSGEIGFNYHPDHCLLDVAAFEEKTARGLSAPAVEMSAAQVAQLEEATALYSGDLLEGFYADWVLQHRERLRITYLNCLKRLMHYHHQQQAYEQSLAYGLKILAAEPLREEIHRHVIRLYHASGERALALRQYELCAEVLAEELAVSPMPETRALYDQVRAAGGPPSTPAQAPADDLQLALRQLDQAQHALESVREQLRQAMQLLNRLLEG